jgi:hypothetical protein
VYEFLELLSARAFALPHLTVVMTASIIPKD